MFLLLHPNHPRKRPKNHDVTKPNVYWETDIKFVPTKYDGHIPILSIIDVFDKSIVGVYIGNSIKAKDFITTLRKAIEYRKINPENLIVRTDNGSQFKAKITSAFMNELNITHEFGYKNNPNSQAYIESFHSSMQYEFVDSIEFDYIDVYNYLLNNNVFGIKMIYTALMYSFIFIGSVMFFAMPVINFLQRKFEFEADNYSAKHLKIPDYLILSLKRLVKENLSNVNPPPLYKSGIIAFHLLKNE